VFSNELQVNCTVSGSVTLDIVYTEIPSLRTIKTVTFNAGASTTTVTGAPTADEKVDSNETVELTLAEGTAKTMERSLTSSLGC
jgi:hypothetical protein